MSGLESQSQSLLVLDLSRLISRAHRNTPTGIDRVELIYAKHLIDRARDRLLFAGMNGLRMFGPLPERETIDFIADVDELWHTGDERVARRVRRSERHLSGRLLVQGERELHSRLRKAAAAVTYLNVSHHHLDQPQIFARLKARSSANIAVLVHDIIPISYPEYARPGQKQRHETRMLTIAQYADRVIVNSTDTHDALLPIFARAGRSPPVAIAPLGIDGHLKPDTSDIEESRPYFVMVGTIESRKNHVLLLNIWRDLARELGREAPLLHIVGHRGWENEHVLDLIERCDAIGDLVVEHSEMSDRSLAKLIAGARALLLPSFTEGYGLPVGEALAMGTPVICSDLPALRELGGTVPDYLDPLDGLGWKKLLVEYAGADSRRRAMQLERLVQWRPPSWKRHFDMVLPLLDG